VFRRRLSSSAARREASSKEPASPGEEIESALRLVPAPADCGGAVGELVLGDVG
jgi:hypothetical protein